MKSTKILLLAAVIGLVASVIGYNWTTTRYPSCELVTKGIGVSTYGCSNESTSATTACVSESPNSSEMIACIDKNYYRYRTIPFGFTQKFGDHSNSVDSKPRSLNALAMFGVGLVLTMVVCLVRRKPAHPVSKA